MTRRIISSIGIVVTVVLLLTIGLFFNVLYNHYSKEEYSQLIEYADMVERGIIQSGTKYLDTFKVNKYRTTLIDEEGRVIYDSHYDSNSMENHLGREEVQEAIKNGTGESKRYSSTLTEEYVYYAKLLEDNMILRMSYARNSVLTLLFGMIQPLLIIFLLSFIVSMILAVRLTKSIVKPLNELNLDKPLENNVYDELSILLRRIDSQQKELRMQKHELQRKSDEINTIVCNMNEGLVLLDGNLHILSINQSAIKVLGIVEEPIGKDIHILCRNLVIQDILSQAKDRIKTINKVKIHGKTYEFVASPILSNDTLVGIVLLFIDATEKEGLERLRREFTANVSHELKTPLQTILGYAELMANHMVKEQDIVKFSSKIHEESKRMVSLIDDIMKLSKLDETAGSLEKEKLNLYTLAQGVVESLVEKATGLNIKLELLGGSCYMQGIPGIIHGILFNLCENAIKYNQPGGSVTVIVKEQQYMNVITIKDTGIGISEEDMSRVFERFYRGDKSRSKEVSGTGIGLSIVKHGVSIHQGMIEMNSKLGIGTEVIVRFPKVSI